VIVAFMLLVAAVALAVLVALLLRLRRNPDSPSAVLLRPLRRIAGQEQAAPERRDEAQTALQRRVERAVIEAGCLEADDRRAAGRRTAAERSDEVVRMHDTFAGVSPELYPLVVARSGRG
jgi:hypothetical protein